jgi:hypothetical protein
MKTQTALSTCYLDDDAVMVVRHARLELLQKFYQRRLIGVQRTRRYIEGSRGRDSESPHSFETDRGGCIYACR